MNVNLMTLVCGLVTAPLLRKGSRYPHFHFPFPLACQREFCLLSIKMYRFFKKKDGQFWCIMLYYILVEVGIFPATLYYSIAVFRIILQEVF